MGIKTCNKCNVDLIVGVNAWKNQYKCKVCAKRYNLKWMNKGEGVYGIFSSETCLYVGESSRLNGRIEAHKTNIKHNHKSYYKHKKLYDNLRRHKNIEFRILEETVNHKEQEKVWIEYMTPLYN